jgi:hypothetical protein
MRSSQLIVSAIGVAFFVAAVAFTLGPLFVRGKVVPPAQRRRLRRLALTVFLLSQAVILPYGIWRKTPQESWEQLIGLSLLLSTLLVMGAVYFVEKERRGKVAVAAYRSYLRGELGAVICDEFGYPRGE